MNILGGFEPINRIHLAFHAYHAVAHDHSQRVESYHFCTGQNDDGVFQCLIFDSPKKNARLIGIEYIIPEEKFAALPADEKPLWHSHKHEVASGLLLPLHSSVAGSAIDTVSDTIKGGPAHETDGKGSGGLRAMPEPLEKMHMQLLYKTYGKIIHTWHPPTSSMPLGPPVLMTSLSEEDSNALCIGNAGPHLTANNPIEARDKRHNFNTAEARERRATYLDHSFAADEHADGWKHGAGVQLVTAPCGTQLSDGRRIEHQSK